jgi:hypothetical protein
MEKEGRKDPGVVVKYRGDQQWQSVAELFRMFRSKGYKITVVSVWG